MSWWWVRAVATPHQSPPKSPRTLSGPASLSYTQEYDPSLPILNTVRANTNTTPLPPPAPTTHHLERMSWAMWVS